MHWSAGRRVASNGVDAKENQCIDFWTIVWRWITARYAWIKAEDYHFSVIRVVFSFFFDFTFFWGAGRCQCNGDVEERVAIFWLFSVCVCVCVCVWFFFPSFLLLYNRIPLLVCSDSYLYLLPGAIDQISNKRQQESEGTLLSIYLSIPLSIHVSFSDVFFVLERRGKHSILILKIRINL